METLASSTTAISCSFLMPSDRDQLASSPEQAIHLNGLAVLQHLVHVSLVIPGLHIKEDGGFRNESWLLGLLLSVRLKPLLSNPLLLGLFFIFTSEEIDIIVIIVACSSSSSCRIICCILASLSKLLHPSSERLDVVVPTKGMRSVCLGRSSKSLVHSSIRLAWHIPLNVAVL